MFYMELVVLLKCTIFIQMLVQLHKHMEMIGLGNKASVHSLNHQTKYSLISVGAITSGSPFCEMTSLMLQSCDTMPNCVF